MKQFNTPASMVHAQVELENCRRSVSEILNDQKAGKKIDGKQLSIYQDRILFLRRWMEMEKAGKSFPCQHCGVAIGLYRELKEKGLTPELLAWLHDKAFGSDTRLKALGKSEEALKGSRYKKAVDNNGG